MAVNAASSSYVNSASSNKGFSGLASGVDTESMVEQLLSGTQAKIDKQEAIKQQLEWKQEIYRDLITQINAFQTKFFSYSSSSNLMSESFFNAMSAVTSSSAFKATATSSAATGSSTLEVRRLATKTSLSSGGAVSGTLLGKTDKAALEELVKQQQGTDADYTVKFKVGAKDVSVNLRDLFVNSDGSFKEYKSSVERDAAIQKKLSEAFKDTGVKVSVKDGAMSLTTEGEKRETVTIDTSSGSLGLKKLGLTTSTRPVSKPSAQTTTLSGKVDDVPKLEFTVALDDLKKTVTLDLRDLMNGGQVDETKLQDALQTALDKAHGKGQILVKGDANGGFSLEVSAGRKVSVSGSSDALAVMGMKNGQSNRVGLGTKLGELSLKTQLQGGSFRFTINGEEFHFTENDTIGDVLEKVNASSAGVRMVYRSQSDTFVLEATESGSGKQINLSQQEGNLLNAFFGAGTAPNGKTITTKALTYPVDTGDKELKGDTTLKDLGLKLLDKDGKELDEKTKLSELSQKSGGLYSFEDGKIIREATGETTLKDLGIKLYDKSGNLLAEDTKLSDLETESGGLYSFEDGRITLTGTFSPGAKDIKAAMKEVFGVEGFVAGITEKPGEGDIPAGTVVEGQNAIVVVDGELTERSSNNFSINGINYDVTDITGSYSDVTMMKDGAAYTLQEGEYIKDCVVYDKDGNAVEGITFQDEDGKEVAAGDLVMVGNTVKKFTGTPARVDVSQNTDEIMDGIKGFMDEYNKLIKTINDYLDEDTNYRDYAPLTADQKKEMSEREIELWEEKAKEGLLHRDSTLQTFLQQMRTVLYEKPANGGYALYELGIETGAWETKGQLTFTTDGEARLRQLLETDPTNVMKLFTDPEDGLGTKLNTILKSTANTTGGSPGTLVQLAGVKGGSTEKNNSIYDQLKSLDDKIAALKRTYEAEKTRYWNQFNTMEQMISNMNAQSSYLAQMMGG